MAAPQCQSYEVLHKFTGFQLAWLQFLSRRFVRSTDLGSDILNFKFPVYCVLLLQFTEDELDSSVDATVTNLTVSGDAEILNSFRPTAIIIRQFVYADGLSTSTVDKVLSMYTHRRCRPCTLKLSQSVSACSSDFSASVNVSTSSSS
jgi:hypothetical protein